jgi:hypothetical protein
MSSRMKFYLPQVPSEAAQARMTIRGRLPPFRMRVIEKIELVGVPHYLFEVEIKDSPAGPASVAVEAVEGTVAVMEPGAEFFEGDDRDLRRSRLPAVTLPVVLTREEAEVKVRTDFRWILLSRALRRRQAHEITAVRGGELFSYPYWLGYYRRRGRWDFEAVDAVSGMGQGSTMRRVILKALVLMERGK